MPLTGRPVIISLEPTPKGREGKAQVLVTAYALTTGKLPSLRSLSEAQRLKYADTKNALEIWKLIEAKPST